MLEGLMKELDGVDLNDPETIKLTSGLELDDPEDGDEIIGVLDEQTIKLNILIAKMRRRAMQMMQEHALLHLDPEKKHDSESEACKSFHEMFGEHRAKIELLQEIAWKALRLDHGLINAESIGLRKGWQVVKCRPEPRDMSGMMVEVLTMSGPDDMAELLSMLGGQTPPRRRRGLFGGH